MREIQASEAKTHLPRLLDDVEGGKTIVITRHGRPVAHLAPAATRDETRVRQALAGIAALRKQARPTTPAEILAARDEGRRPGVLEHRGRILVIPTMGGPVSLEAANAALRATRERDGGG